MYKRQIIATSLNVFKRLELYYSIIRKPLENTQKETIFLKSFFPNRQCKFTLSVNKQIGQNVS